MRRAKNSIVRKSVEPLWDIHLEDDKSQLICMLNWYNYHKSSSDAKKYFIEFLKKSGESKSVIDAISKSSSSISSTIGWLCRIKLVNGEKFPVEYDSYISNEKNKILKSSHSNSNDEVKNKTKKPSIQENLENQLNEYLSDLSKVIDDFQKSNYKLKFNSYEWFKTNNVKHQQAKKVAEYFEKNLLNELKEVQNNNCDQLKEAYSHLDKKELSLFIKFIESIIVSSEKWYDVNKQISLDNKAPRKVKPKSPVKQVEKLQFLKEHESLKSVPPTKIVGATQLWVYNVKYRILGVYICTNAHGFSVKGCTLLNFDSSQSICKKLRVPEKFLDKVLSGGKVALRKIMPSIRTKEKKLTGRINKDTILLKVL